MNIRTLTTLLTICLLASPSSASEFGWQDRCRPVGAWFVTVTFPAAGPFEGLVFQQLVTLNADRTLDETNTNLHANSFPDPNAIPMPPLTKPPFNGSDGHGAWKRLPGCRIHFSFLKFLYTAVDLPADPPKRPDAIAAGGHLGFLKVSGEATIRGNRYFSNLEDTTTKILFGPYPNSPAGEMDLGPSIAMGDRLLATD